MTKKNAVAEAKVVKEQQVENGSTPIVEGADSKVLAEGTNGKLYQLNVDKKTCKKVFKDFADLEGVINEESMDLRVYQAYLHDKFGEDAPIKKGKLNFRGYRISCTIEDGFIIEDSQNHYQIVNAGFDGIPTPRELGDWFRKPKKTFTQEELKKAVEIGKKVEQVAEKATEVEVDFKKCQRKVLRKINDIRKRIDPKFDPMTFVDMIPFKRWQRKTRALLKQWTEKKIRYPKFLDLLEQTTSEETFVIEEKAHRNPFKGTILPEYESVGYLKGDKIEVDGKWIDAVPFIIENILYEVPSVMPQIMKWGRGEITDMELINDPYKKDWKEEYSIKVFRNSAEGALVLTALAREIGIFPPQDLVYASQCDLKVGDKVRIWNNDKWINREVKSLEWGITLKGDILIEKSSSWIKL